MKGEKFYELSNSIVKAFFDEVVCEIANAEKIKENDVTWAMIVRFLAENDEERKEAKERRVYINTYNTLVQKSPKAEDYLGEFNALWAIYPRKQGRKDALRHYTAARKDGVSYLTVEEGIYRYLDYIKRNNISINYIKMGSSWFCQRSWDDDYSAQFSKGQTKPNAFHNFDERTTDYDALFGGR